MQHHHMSTRFGLPTTGLVVLITVFLLATGFANNGIPPATAEQEPIIKTQYFASVSTPASSFCTPDRKQTSGALYRICMPEAGRWNGDLVLYAHGYVAFNEPLRIPEDQLEVGEETSIPQIITDLGFAFATTSYSTNGLAIRPGIADIVDLVDIFTQEVGQPQHIYLVGPSEGGIITALAVERYPDIFDGGVAACGPIGDFRQQINYWGDFRVIFNYYFPDVLPGTAVEVPNEVIENWQAVYAPQVVQAVQANPAALQAILRITLAPIDPNDLNSAMSTLMGILWYNVFATNDGVEKLGGQPFDNRHRFYFGSADDLRLNRRVPRYQADEAALTEIERYYQTTGQLARRLITIHTTGDPIVPYWHANLYRYKTMASGADHLHTDLTVQRYGHCNFTVDEVMVAFALLVFEVTGQEIPGVEQLVQRSSLRAVYWETINRQR